MDEESILRSLSALCPVVDSVYLGIYQGLIENVRERTPAKFRQRVIPKTGDRMLRYPDVSKEAGRAVRFEEVQTLSEYKARQIEALVEQERKLIALVLGNKGEKEGAQIERAKEQIAGLPDCGYAVGFDMDSDFAPEQIRRGLVKYRSDLLNVQRIKPQFRSGETISTLDKRGPFVAVYFAVTLSLEEIEGFRTTPLEGKGGIKEKLKEKMSPLIKPSLDYIVKNF